MTKARIKSLIMVGAVASVRAALNGLAVIANEHPSDDDDSDIATADKAMRALAKRHMKSAEGEQ